MNKINQIFSVETLSKVFFFFPIQLVWMHLKKSHLLLLFWLILFGFVAESFAKGYGVPYLFLYPEYLGNVNFLSHLILGFSSGGFIMAFNISTYISNGFRFPFIATLSRPFVKFSINNFIIPLLFILFYLYKMITFQYQVEFEPLGSVLINAVSFILGNIIFFFISFQYFFRTNTDIFKLFGLKEQEHAQTEVPKKKYSVTNPVKGMLHKRERWYNIFNRDREWTVTTYLNSFTKVSIARDSSHYDKKMLHQVFSQNHINASLFELIVLITVVILGVFREKAEFMIPAGASVFLLLTMFLMIFSALNSWLKGWSTTVFILLIFLVNFLSRYPTFSYRNYAYGLNYVIPGAEYSNDKLKEHVNNIANVNDDYDSTLAMLNNWRLRNSVNTIERREKPKLVILNCSGGGSRSALWTFHALQHADSLLNGQLLNHAFLIAGSSGGMVGAAYLRELHLLRQSQELNLYNDSFANNISKDMLNSVSFSIAVNDMFFRFQKFNDGKYRYTKDRGYAFETQLNLNTHGILNKRLSDYTEPERKGLVPMMVFSPTVEGDGRRMIVSSQKVSYLLQNAPLDNTSNNEIPEAIEFSRFFEKQDPGNLRFLSALRMSATFPIIMPNVSLPSEPAIEVMDAGIRDNFGMLVTLKFLYTFRNWISTNTSGVVIIQTRDLYKDFDVDVSKKTMLDGVFSPLGSFYNNITKIQSFNQDELVQYASLWFDGSLDVVSLQLPHSSKEKKISLSWHLTNKEKKRIKEAIYIEHNQKEIQRVVSLLE